MIVRLSPQDLITAASIGMRRQVFAMSNGLRQYGNGNAEWFDAHIMGAMAEFAVARTLNLFWDHHIGEIKGGDVGGCVEVRMRRMPGTGTDLAIRPKDNDAKPFVLVHGYRDGRMDLVGWLYGAAAKLRGGAWCEANEVWFVPPPYDPIETLIEIYKPQP